MDDLFDPAHEALSELVEFIGLPERARFLDSRAERVDRWRKTTHLPLDWKRVAAYPHCVAAAAELGYDLRRVAGR